jgi:hypothetical protein
VYADFKTDGTYIIKIGAWASKIHLYGSYSLHDGIIEIDTSKIDDILISNRFLIKDANPYDESRKPEYDRLETKKYLIQIDRSGNEIKLRHVFEDTLPYRFEIVINNMK